MCNRSAISRSVIILRQRRTPFIHVRVRLHGVVSRQLHWIPALYLAEGELDTVIFVAPHGKPCHIVLKKVEAVSIFYGEFSNFYRAAIGSKSPASLYIIRT